jgi:hypothetical protein
MKTLFRTIAFATILTIGATFANAGLIISDLNGADPKVPCTEKTDATNWGIIISDLTGIIISDFTGIIISDATGDVPPTDVCGIIISD